MTLAPATLIESDSAHARVQLGNGATLETRIARDGLPTGAPLEIGLRPENVSVATAGEGATDAQVELVERLGDRTLVYTRLDDGLEMIAVDGGASTLRIGDRVGLRIDGGAAHLFGPDGGAHHAEP